MIKIILIFFIFFAQIFLIKIANSQTVDEALSQLKEITVKCSSEFGKPVVKVFKRPDNAWGKRSDRSEIYEYDAKKTDSLVSPLIGQITSVVTASDILVYKSENEARNDKSPIQDHIRSFTRANLKFIDGKWVVENAENWSSFLQPGRGTWITTDHFQNFKRVDIEFALGIGGDCKYIKKFLQ